jgi:hypothetical protein
MVPRSALRDQKTLYFHAQELAALGGGGVKATVTLVPVVEVTAIFVDGDRKSSQLVNANKAVTSAAAIGLEFRFIFLFLSPAFR